MKMQVNGVATCVGSSKWDSKLLQQAVNPPEGKRYFIEVTLTDDEGNDVVFRLNPRLHKTGSLGALLTMKAEGKLVAVETSAAPTKDEKKANRLASAQKELESQLLG